jgi:hypothetical protein
MPGISGISIIAQRHPVGRPVKPRVSGAGSARKRTGITSGDLIRWPVFKPGGRLIPITHVTGVQRYKISHWRKLLIIIRKQLP